MNLLQSKVFSLVILGLSSIFVGILPNCFAQQGRRQWPLFLSSLLCFGGGVLLSTSVVHILPELREALPQKYRHLTEIIYCLGFFLLYIIDEIVHFFYGGTEEANILHNHGQHGHAAHDGHHSQNSHAHPTTYIDRRNSEGFGTSSYGAMERRSLLLGENKQHPYNPSFYRAQSDSALFCDEIPSQLCHVGHQEPCHAAPTASLGLLVALSVHTLLEGLVVGLETKVDKVLLLLGAIASHKLVVSFCLGMELASNASYTFMRHFLYILIFSLGSVAGILTGMLIYNIPGEVKTIAIPILQALAGGTLLYVTVSEVLPRERARWHQQHERRSAGLLQFFSVLFGFVLMTSLSRYLDYDG